MKTIIRTERSCTSNNVVRALFISLYRCFCLFPPVPRDRKGRGARLRAPARVPGIHKTCPVASAGAKRKTVPSSEISEDSLADPPQKPGNKGWGKNTLKVRRQEQRKPSLVWGVSHGLAARAACMWQQHIESGKLELRARERVGGGALIIVDNGQLTWAGSASCSE